MQTLQTREHRKTISTAIEVQKFLDCSVRNRPNFKILESPQDILDKCCLKKQIKSLHSFKFELDI